MPRGIKNKNIKIMLDNKKQIDLNEDMNDLNFESNEITKVIAPNEVLDSEQKTKTSDLKKKFPSRTLEELRKIDYVHQYESRFPKIERPGYKVVWICNTPDKDNISLYHKQGYDIVDDAPTVVSGYSDLTGEDRYLYHAMMMPIEIYEKKQKAHQDLTNKMYGHILNPDKKGKYIEGDGMYEPKGREVKTINRVETAS